MIYIVSPYLYTCIFNSRYTTTVTVTEQKPYQVKEYSWCFNIPPKCSKYKIEYRTIKKVETLPKKRPVEYCCPGYGETADSELCVPVCSEPCVHGICEAPDKCKCNNGYGGISCDKCSYLFMFYIFMIVHMYIGTFCFIFVWFQHAHPDFGDRNVRMIAIVITKPHAILQQADAVVCGVGVETIARSLAPMARMD